MSNKKSFAVKADILFTFILGTLYLLDFLYTKTVAKNFYSKPIWVFDKKNGNYDYAILGDSRVLYTMDINAIGKYSGLKGINLGTTASRTFENYLVLNRFLQTNKCNTVLVQVDATIIKPIDRSDWHIAYGPSLLMPYINEPDIDSFIYRYTPIDRYLLMKYVPFMRYAEYNTQYAAFYINKKAQHDMDDNGYEAIHDAHGSAILKGDQFLKEKYSPREMDSLMEENMIYLHRIVELCRQKDIQVVLFTSPYHEVLNQYPVQNYCNEVFSRLAKSKSIPYWNLSSLFWNKNDKLYGDAFHTNLYAADELAVHMADSLKTIIPHK